MSFLLIACLLVLGGQVRSQAAGQDSTINTGPLDDNDGSIVGNQDSTNNANVDINTSKSTSISTSQNDNTNSTSSQDNSNQNGMQQKPSLGNADSIIDDVMNGLAGFNSDSDANGNNLANQLSGMQNSGFPFFNN